MGNLVDSDAATYDSMFDANVRQPFNALHAVVPGMAARGDGFVCGFSSESGWTGRAPGFALYAAALLADVAVCAAAVADWRAEEAPQKIKKKGAPPALRLVENLDILATLSAAGNARPRLVVGFAAETENLVENARVKRATKGCDWILANDVSAAAGTFGGDRNTIHLVTEAGAEDWPPLSKHDVAERLAQRIAAFFGRAAAE